jgi:HTH-type transcriptional regulator, sugar sensing transcriptional regulator
MLVKQDLINKIKDYFDLNIYETKVWLALLGKGAASAGEIAQISGVPRSRTYDVLEGLEKKGFAIIKLGKPVKYFGVKPNMVLEKMKNNVKKQAEEKVDVLGRIRDTDEYTELESLYKESIEPIKREDVSAALKGRSNITNYLREIIVNAEKEVIFCTNAQEMNRKLKLFTDTFALLTKNGVKVKVALSGDEILIKQIEKRLNLKVKKIDIDAKFFIVDRKEILFYISKSDSKEDLAIWLNSDFFAEAFGSLYDKAVGGKK